MHGLWFGNSLFKCLKLPVLKYTELIISILHSDLPCEAKVFEALYQCKLLGSAAGALIYVDPKFESAFLVLRP